MKLSGSTNLPSKLIETWADMLAHRSDKEVFEEIAQYGADQELEACCQWLDFKVSASTARLLKAERRLNLKQQALIALHAVATGANDMREQTQDLNTIRQALEQLDD